MAEIPVDDTLWCRNFRPAPDAPVRLVCFPHAGGSASFYLPVASALTPDADVLAIQYPGRQDRRREPCVDDIATLAEQVHTALAGWLDRPVVFFGHSMGALVAFEVARRMERDGQGPARLVASGRRAPSRYRDENVHRRDDDGIVAELREMSGTDTRVLGDEEMLRMVLPAIRADYRAVETYRSEPGASVRCPVTVMVGDDDPRTSLDEAEDWKGHTTGAFDMQVHTGGHFYLSSQAPAVIKALRGHLAAVPASPRG
ncbi:thioesterase II family protein [Streptomyces syringium]|uniref:thioesterase II family protein n=1 Tax=Streptomyces syringium TaxID=76729 RepID=UPI003447E3F7